MKFPYFARLSCFALLISPIIISCKGGSDSKSVSEGEKESTFFNAKLLLGAEAGSISDKLVNRDTFTLKGTYHSCAGKVEGDTWILTKNTEKTTTLQIKKSDSNCKLKVTGFEFVKSGSKNEVVNYEFIAPTADPTQKGYLLTESFSIGESAKFLRNTNNVGFPGEFYSKLNISPANFSDKPTISIYLSELENFDWEKIRDSIKYENATIFSHESIFLSVNQIKVPDYSIENDNFKVVTDKDTKDTVYEGKFKFKSTNTNATSYMIVGNEDLSNFNKVDSIFKNTENESKKTLIIAKSGNTLEIEGAKIAKKAAFPLKLIENQTVKANIIFANTDSSGMSSYKVATITIISK